MLDSEADAGLAGVNDDVSRDQVVVPLLDADAVADSGHAVSLDHVPAAGAERDPPAVADEAIVFTRKPSPSSTSIPSSPFRASTFPLIRPFVEPTGLIPAWTFPRKELCRTRMWREKKMPSPLPSGSVVRSPELFRTRIRSELAEPEAAEMVSLRRNPEQAGAAGLEGDDAGLEVAHRAVLHGHPAATFEGNPDVAKIRGDRSRNRGSRLRRSCGRSGRA